MTNQKKRSTGWPKHGKRNSKAEKNKNHKNFTKTPPKEHPSRPRAAPRAAPEPPPSRPEPPEPPPSRPRAAPEPLPTPLAIFFVVFPFRSRFFKRICENRTEMVFLRPKANFRLQTSLKRCKTPKNGTKKAVQESQFCRNPDISKNRQGSYGRERT